MADVGSGVGHSRHFGRVPGPSGLSLTPDVSLAAMNRRFAPRAAVTSELRSDCLANVVLP